MERLLSYEEFRDKFKISGRERREGYEKDAKNKSRIDFSINSFFFFGISFA
jgi:hypothetical protein